MTALGLGAVFVLLLANALFVVVEFSLVAVDRAKLRDAIESGDRRAQLVGKELSRLSSSLSGAQLGITISSLGLGVLARPVVAEVLNSLFGGAASDRRASAAAMFMALVVTTVVQIVVAELVPKAIAVATPMKSAVATVPIFRVFSWLTAPLIAVSNASTSRIVRLLGFEPADALTKVRNRQELRRLVESSESTGAITRSDAAMLERTFRFGEKFAADALTPRVSVHALPLVSTVDDLLAISEATGLSRFPVYGDDLDDIRGVVHIKDVLGIKATERRGYPVVDLLRPVLAVPESKELESLMVELQGAAGQFAVVVDEYGGTAGIITLEDLIEEIVGEIDDEHDSLSGVPAVRRWGGLHLLAGLLHPDEVREACGFEVPRGGYETLGGFVIQQLGCIPQVGDTFEFEGWELTVREMDVRRVATVALTAPRPGQLEVQHPGRLS